jgi:DNA-binding CsgD family transcriptional regulator
MQAAERGVVGLRRGGQDVAGSSSSWCAFGGTGPVPLGARLGRGWRTGDALDQLRWQETLERAGAPGVGCESVLGRKAELACADEFLVAAGKGYSVLQLEGDAGIGKTAIWREVLRRAQALGALILSCRPVASEGRLSFASVVDMLAPIDAAALAALAPGQREVIGGVMFGTVDSGGSSQLRNIATGFLALVRHLATTRPVVLAVDNVQWLDSASRLVIEFVARRLANETVGLLCSVRMPAPGLVTGDSPAFCQRVVLGPLSLAAIGRIVADRTGQAIPRPVLVRVTEASGGNPFYALEICQLLAERGLDRAPGAALPLPRELRELVATRMRRLPPASQDALLLAAVLKSPDTYVVDAAALAPAREQGIVRVDDESGKVEFAHPVLAAAVAASVGSASRDEAHRQAASLVNNAEERARHLALASQGPDPEVASRLDEAAELATSRGATDVVVELVDLAVLSTPASDTGKRCERLLREAQVHFDLGEMASASALADQVLQHATGDLRAKALRLSAHLHARRSDFGSAASAAAEAFAVASGDVRLKAEMELTLAYCSASLGDCLKAGVHGRAAIEHARASGERGLLGEALGVTAFADFMAGKDLDEDALALALALESPRGAGALVLRPGYVHGILQLWTGDLDGAQRELGALRSQAREHGQDSLAPILLFFLAWTCLWQGNLAQAARFSDELDDAAALHGDPYATAMALASKALVHAHGCKAEAARDEAARSLAFFHQLGWAPGVVWASWAMGLAETSLGNPSAVHAALGPLAAQLTGGGDRECLAREPGEEGFGDPSMFVFLLDEIEALVALGELEEAEKYLAPFEQSAVRLGRPWVLAGAGRLRGLVEAARGENEASSAHFAAAQAGFARADMPFERARTLLLAGEACRRSKQRAKARELLDEARSIFEAVGAAQWAAKANAELARLGTRNPADALTGTERVVAELVVLGLSNREVADRAFVSVKTVEACLTRVYRKLGVRSRAALGVVLAVRA